MSTTLSNAELNLSLVVTNTSKFREAAVYVDFSGWFKDDFGISLAMEYVPLGDLERYLMAPSTVPEIGA